MQFLFLLLIIPLVCGDKVVVTNNGPVKAIHFTNKNVYAFLGIPYAEPPVGPLRFAKPIPKSSWEETYNAVELPVACIQSDSKDFEFLVDRSKKMSEDCLFLNVWVPEGGKDLKTVMIFIHGGGFMLGSSNMALYEASTLAKHGDVIVASMNYRVGTLGFFSAFIDEAEGNMGLYDQLMAIQWIKDNAKHFGGDPENIVLFGESAGAYSVSLHLISPLSKNLFKRGILQSGSAFHPMHSDGNEALYKNGQIIANMLGCADNNEELKKNPEAVVNCLKSLPVERFMKEETIFFRSYGWLVPRVGDDFLPLNPIDSFQKGHFKKSELLLGINHDEGPFFLGLFRPDIFGTFGDNVDTNVFNETAAREVSQGIIKADIGNEIFSSYLSRVENESGYTYLKAASDILGDYFVTCNCVFHADYESLKDNTVYFYMFDYRSPASLYAKWMGVPHFDEIPYVFGNPMHGEFTEDEKEISRHIMDMWVAFANTGNPSLPGGLELPKYTHKDPKYFIIGEKDRIGKRPDNYRCEAWRNFYRSSVDL